MKTQKSTRPIILWILLAVIILLGAFLRFYQIGEQSFWLDEAASYSAITSGFPEFVSTGNMAMFYLLAALWTRLVPLVTEASLRSLTAIFSILSIPLMFFAGKAIFEDERKGLLCGLLAAFLLAINSTEVRYAQEFRSYSLTTLLTLASTLLLIQLVKESAKKTRNLVLYTLITVAAIYSHMYAGLLVAAQVVSLLFLIPAFKADAHFLRRLLLSYFCVILLLIPLALLILTTGSSPLGWLGQPKLSDIPKLFLFLTGTTRPGYLIIHLAFTLLGALGGIGIFSKSISQQRWRFILLLINIVLPIGLSFIVSLVLQPIFIDRYLLMTSPYLTLLVAAGIVTAAELLHKAFPKALPLPLVAAVFAVLFGVLAYSGLSNYYENFSKEDWRSAANILATHCQQSLRIYYPDWLAPSVKFYEPSLNPIAPAELRAYLQELKVDGNDTLPQAENYERACLVFSHLQVGERSQNAELLRQAIQKQFPNALITELNSVTVEIYSR
jgi:uncharacterized membrane protein